MRGIKPHKALWKKVNLVLVDADNLGVVVVTMMSGLCQLLIHSGAAKDEDEARCQLAAMTLSPDDRPHAGGLLPRLQAEIAKLEDGNWLN